MPSPTTPTSSHVWKLHHKQLLCVLGRFFKISGSSDNATVLVAGASRILCRIFADEAGRSGVSPWLSDPAARRMLFELSRRSKQAYLDVFIETDFADTANVWAEHRSQLISAASALGIQLSCRRKDHPDAFKHYRKLKAGSPRSPKSGATRNMPSPRKARSPRQKPVTPVKQSTAELRAEQASWDSFSYEAKMSNRFAYRVFSPASYTMNSKQGCWPSNFTGTADPIPLRSSAKFKKHATIHLTPLPEPSSILSLTPSLFAALSHAQSLGPSATILIIDLRIVTKGQPPARLTPAKMVIRKHLQGFQGVLKRNRSDPADGVAAASTEQKAYSFHGNIELVVWGPIPEDAIISAVGVDELQEFLRQNPVVDNNLFISRLGTFDNSFTAGKFIAAQRIRSTRKVGRSAGALLAFLGLDKKRAATAAEQIERRWQIKRHVKTQAAGLKRSKVVGPSVYMAGFYEGFNIKKLSDLRASFSLKDFTAQATPDTAESSDDGKIKIQDDIGGDESGQWGTARRPLQSGEIIDLTWSDEEVVSDWDSPDDNEERLQVVRKPVTLANTMETLNLSGYRWTSE